MEKRCSAFWKKKSVEFFFFFFSLSLFPFAFFLSLFPRPMPSVHDARIAL